MTPRGIVRPFQQERSRASPPPARDVAEGRPGSIIDIMMRACSLVLILVASTSLLAGPDLIVYVHRPVTAAPGLSAPVEVWYQNASAIGSSGAWLTIDTPYGVTKAPHYCSTDGARTVCDLGPLPPASADDGYVRMFEVEVGAPEVSDAAFPVVLEIFSDEGDDPVPFNNQKVLMARTYNTRFVDTTADSGAGSLRAAIEWANANCSENANCLIAFRIPPDGSSWQTIQLESPLPSIRREVIIDATTQAGYFGDTNPAGPEIELTGGGLNSVAFDFAAACGGVLRGLTINGFQASAVLAVSGDDCRHPTFRRIEKNYIGTDPTGSNAAANDRGIWVASPGWTIEGNVISGNRFAGIFIERGQTSVKDNIIGLDAALANGLGNGASGIYVAAGAGGTDIRDNHIGFNHHFGVGIAPDAQHVSAAPNSFQANQQMAIDWGLDGAVTSDPVPVPEITSVRVENDATIITGVAKSRRLFAPVITVYANAEPDASGFGEGQYLLGEVRAEQSSDAFTFTHPSDLRGLWITVTTTEHHYYGFVTAPRPVRDESATDWGYVTTTSEFSRAFEVK
jgi:parallel beta-helix repeat protein